MKPIPTPRFGNFGLLQTTAALLRAREEDGPRHGRSEFTYAQDAVVAEAFEQVREGAAPDALLWDRQLASSFVQRCRGHGLDAIELRERCRYLYIARNDCLQSIAREFSTGRAFSMMARGIWNPRLDAIDLQFVQGERICGVGMGKWEIRLIRDRDPVFNWPIQQRAA